MSKKVKVNYVRWELVPVYNEVYIDEKELEEISKIDDDYERLEYIEDFLRDDEFIYTSQDTDWESPDYDGELNKFYTKHNEHSIYVSSAINIDDIYISKDFNKSITSEINELEDGYNLLEIHNVNSVIRDRKLNKILGQ